MSATLKGQSWLGRLGQWLVKQGEMTLARGGSDDSAAWVVVFSGTQMEAEVMRGHLEVENVPCMMQREAAATVIGLSIGPLAAVNVLVPAALAERALAVLTVEEELEAAADEGVEQDTEQELPSASAQTRDVDVQDQ